MTQLQGVPLPTNQLDLGHIWKEARYRWLRPREICKILTNSAKFNISDHTPTQPRAPSTFLFDRQKLRHFRKDGHKWQKRKDGKNIKEAHEKLKIDSVEVLHCYYAREESNENFQRRCYWMLDPAFENIVFVHYREEKKGYRSAISRSIADPGSKSESLPMGSVPPLPDGNSPAPTVETSHASTSRIDWNGQTLSSETEDVDSGDYPITSSPAQPVYGSILCTDSLDCEVAGFPESGRNPSGSWFAGFNPNHSTGSYFLPEIHYSITNTIAPPDQKLYVEQSTASHDVLDVLACGHDLISDVDVQAVRESPHEVIQVEDEYDFDLDGLQSQNYSGPQKVVLSSAEIENEPNISPGKLEKIDSFGRWLDRQILGYPDDSFITCEFSDYWSS